LIVDAGPSPGGTESSVLDLTVDPPALLRAGAVDRAAIEEELGVVLHVPGP
jgi:tRNA A37 threonylcarbamoyladenosine synthetase subunit TsaC/SUA5/YrdC